VLFKELELEEKHGYHFIEVDGAEGDDVIATIMNKCSDDYAFKILFASDRDFVQLENVHQINLFGKEVLCEVANEPVTRQEYLLTKILVGDTSDNIKQVFPRVGPKRALALVRNKEELKKKLTENQDAAKQYQLNKKLIAFSEIPNELSQKIVEKFNEVMYTNEILNTTKFGNIDWL
jgi:5'-3' exonuclease